MKKLSIRILPVAVAVAAAISGQAQAAKTSFATADIKVVGTEKAAIDVAADPGAVEALPAIVVEVGSNGYTNTDRVTLAVSGANVRSGADIGTVTCAANGLAGPPTMTLTYSATLSSGNNVVLEVGGRNASAVFAAGTGMLCTIPAGGIKLESSGLRSASTVALNWTAASAQGTVYDRMANDANGTIGAVNVLVAAAQTSLTPNDNVAYRDPRTNDLLASALGMTSTNGVRSRGLDGVVPSTGLSFTATDGASCAATDNDCLYRDTLRFNLRNEAGDAALALGANDGLAVLSPTGANIIAAAGTKYVTTISGDFSFLDDDANGCSDLDLSQGPNRAVAVSRTVNVAAGVFAATATLPDLTLATDCQSLTHTYTYAVADGRDTTHAIDFSIRGYSIAAAVATAIRGAGASATAAKATGRVISPRSFTASTLWRNAGLTTTYATLTPSAGTWTPAATTAASTALVPYVPYGAGISRIIYVTNKDSLVSGTATFSATRDSGATCAATNFASVAIPAGGVVNVGGLIDAGLRACFPTIDSDSGKASVTITVTGSSAPAIEVASSYNVSGNRNVVLNTSNEN